MFIVQTDLQMSTNICTTYSYKYNMGIDRDKTLEQLDWQTWKMEIDDQNTV